MASIHIQDSCYISKRDFSQVLDWYEYRHPGNPVFKKRSRFSLKTEWATHNALYDLGIRREQTASVDLNYPQKIWERLVYPMAGCLVWLFIK